MNEMRRVEELRGIVIECTEFDCKSLFSVTCKKNRNAERKFFSDLLENKFEILIRMQLLIHIQKRASERDCEWE